MFRLFHARLERNKTRGTGGGLVAKLFGLLEFAVNGGGGEAGFFGNLPDGLMLGLEVDEFLQVFGLGEGILGAEVIGFADGVFIDELGVAPDLLEFEEKNLLSVVLVDAGADLDLLDVAEASVLGAAADGDAGIEEVHQFGTAGQVILGERAAGFPFGRMPDNDQGEAVMALEGEDFLHESAGGFAVLGVVEQEGDVVNEDVADVPVFGCRGYAFQNGVFQVGIHDVFRAYFSPEQGVREAVDGPGAVLLDVAHLELLCGEFAVQVEDSVLPGDGFGHLGGQDGFAGVGGGKEDGAFSFDQ